MAQQTPNSYRDPYWLNLAGSTEQKLGLPPGLLVSVLTKGERSNADQVSEAGARTPFQIIPQTRKAAIDKWGIDPYLSPENSAEVAGLLLKDSLQRNKGDVAAAVGEYHGGTDRKNWGPRTRSYIDRVTGGQAARPAAAAAGAPEASDRALIARAYEAYRAGRMDPEAAAEFEQDVNSGLVQLPLGASLKRAQAPAAADFKLPPSVIDAYTSGRMDPEARAQLEADVRENPSLLPQGMELAGSRVQAAIPGQSPETLALVGGPARPHAPEQPRTLADRAIGVGEAALTTITGATGGALGMAAGTVKGLAQSIADGSFGTPQAAQYVQQEAERMAQAGTYEPRTPTGQQYAADVGQLMQAAIPIAGVAPAMIPPGSVAPARAAVADAARAVPGAVRDAGIVARDAVVQRLPEAVRPGQQPTPGTFGSAGAAGTDKATQRIALAESMGFTGDAALTKGQATRNAAQLKFEVETAKMPEEGVSLRQRRINQNAKVLENFDTWIDQTGAEAPTLRAVGSVVDDVLVKQSKRDKTEVKVAYAKADKSPEAAAPVDAALRVTVGEGDDAITSTPFEYINSHPDGIPANALVDSARKYAAKIGVADLRETGELVPRQGATVKQFEDWRKAINAATGNEPQDKRHAAILKQLIDGQTEPVIGQLYKRARALRTQYSQNYKNRATIAKLLSYKRGTQDRQVALEDVFDFVVNKGSLDDLSNARRVLYRAGADGQQAWKELQGATLRSIRDKATQNIATDSSGNAVISPRQLRDAIVNLDNDGKLDLIFGKQGAQRMRDISDLVQESYTVPPEAAINHANTAMTLLMAFGDIAASGATGMPAPLATGSRMVLKYIKSKKLRARIADALNELDQRQSIQRNQPAGRP